MGTKHPHHHQATNKVGDGGGLFQTPPPPEEDTKRKKADHPLNTLLNTHHHQQQPPLFGRLDHHGILQVRHRLLPRAQARPAEPADALLHVVRRRHADYHHDHHRHRGVHSRFYHGYAVGDRPGGPDPREHRQRVVRDRHAHHSRLRQLRDDAQSRSRGHPRHRHGRSVQHSKWRQIPV